MKTSPVNFTSNSRPVAFQCKKPANLAFGSVHDIEKFVKRNDNVDNDTLNKVYLHDPKHPDKDVTGRKILKAIDETKDNMNNVNTILDKVRAYADRKNLERGFNDLLHDSFIAGKEYDYNIRRGSHNIKHLKNEDSFVFERSNYKDAKLTGRGEEVSTFNKVV